MRKRRLLLAATALITVVGACDRTKKPRVYANDKGSRYPMPLDAGVADAAPIDDAAIGADAPLEKQR
jgi:hypothetical protein